MAITTYLTLKQAIGNWLGREDLTNRIPEFIALAEDRIARNLRVQAMETTATLTISSSSASVPSGYLETIRLYLTSDTRRKLDYMSPAVFQTRNAQFDSGDPQIFTIEGTAFKFAPTGDGTAELLYYKRFDALSSNADANWILTNARGLLLYGSLLEAYLFLEDDAGVAQYATLFDNLMNDVNEDDRKARFPRGALPMRGEVAVY